MINYIWYNNCRNDIDMVALVDLGGVLCHNENQFR
jgi:hypothetical protein